MSKVYKIFQQEMRITEHLQKKHLVIFWFLVGDFNISDIFHKIQISNKWPVFPIITTDLILSLIPGPLLKSIILKFNSSSIALLTMYIC